MANILIFENEETGKHYQDLLEKYDHHVVDIITSVKQAKEVINIMAERTIQDLENDCGVDFVILNSTLSNQIGSSLDGRIILECFEEVGIRDLVKVIGTTSAYHEVWGEADVDHHMSQRNIGEVVKFINDVCRIPTELEDYTEIK